MIRRQASCVVASGFSQKTGLPAATAASTYSSCVGPHEQTSTASTESSLTSSSPVEWTFAFGRPSATFFASSRLTSVTAVTPAPASTVVSRRMWSLPIMPTPITPTLTVTCDSSCAIGTFGESIAGGPASSALGGLEFVGQLGELAAAGHLGREFFQGDLGALLVQYPLAEFEDDEVVADQVGVVRVVGDEHDAQPGITRGSGVLEHHTGLFDTQGSCRLVQDQHAGTEVHRPGNGHALP